MTDKTAKVKLALIGRCVSEGFTTAVNNAQDSHQVLNKLAMSIKDIQKPNAGKPTDEKLAEMKSQIMELYELTIETIVQCTAKGTIIEQIAQELSRFAKR